MPRQFSGSMENASAFSGNAAMAAWHSMNASVHEPGAALQHRPLPRESLYGAPLAALLASVAPPGAPVGSGPIKKSPDP